MSNLGSLLQNLDSLICCTGSDQLDLDQNWLGFMSPKRIDRVIFWRARHRHDLARHGNQKIVVLLVSFGFTRVRIPPTATHHFQVESTLDLEASRDAMTAGKSPSPRRGVEAHLAAQSAPVLDTER